MLVKGLGLFFALYPPTCLLGFPFKKQTRSPSLVGSREQALRCGIEYMFQSAQAAVTGYHKLSQPTFISSSPGDWALEIVAPAWWGSGEDPFLGCKLLTSHCVLTWRRAERGGMLSHDSSEGTNPIYEAPPSRPHPHPNYLPKTHLLTPSHSGVGI